MDFLFFEQHPCQSREYDEMCYSTSPDETTRSVIGTWESAYSSDQRWLSGSVFATKHCLFLHRALGASMVELITGITEPKVTSVHIDQPMPYQRASFAARRKAKYIQKREHCPVVWNDRAASMQESVRNSTIAFSRVERWIWKWGRSDRQHLLQKPARSPIAQMICVSCMRLDSWETSARSRICKKNNPASWWEAVISLCDYFERCSEVEWHE